MANQTRYTQVRFPTAAFGGGTWTLGAGASQHEAVDDPTDAPDEEETYIYRQDSGARARWDFTPFSLPDDAKDIIITVYMRVRESVGSATINGALVVGGTIYDGTTQSITSSYADYTAGWSTNPDTLAAWLVADVNGTGSNAITSSGGFGVRATSVTAGEEVRCTQNYVTASYTLPIYPTAGQLRTASKRPQVANLSDLTAAYSGIARSGVTRSGHVATTVRTLDPFLDVTIDDDYHVNAIDVADMSIAMGLNSEPSTMSATIVPRGGFEIDDGQQIRVYLGGDETGIPLFSGVMLRVTEEINRTSHELEYLVEATDYRWLLDRFALVSEFYWQRGINSIVADLLATYADPASGFTTGYLDANLGTVGFIELDNLRLTECLDRLARTVDGGAFWEVDAKKRVSIYKEPSDEGNAITLADGGSWRHLRRERDVAPVVTRVIFIGGGSALTSTAAAGATTLSVEETGWYNPDGGSVRCPCNTVTYTGVSIGSGPGDLTGVAGLIHDVPQGTTCWNLYQADDTDAQTDLASRLGDGQSGIATYQDSDHRFGYDRTQQAAEGLLDLLKTPTTTVTWDQVPETDTETLTHLRPGRLGTLALTVPRAMTGTVRLRHVELMPHARRSDGALTFARRVEAATSRRAIAEAFKEALSQ